MRQLHPNKAIGGRGGLPFFPVLWFFARKFMYVYIISSGKNGPVKIGKAVAENIVYSQSKRGKVVNYG
jgi:hypothetical protein